MSDHQADQQLKTSYEGSTIFSWLAQGRQRVSELQRERDGFKLLAEEMQRQREDLKQKVVLVFGELSSAEPC